MSNELLDWLAEEKKEAERRLPTEYRETGTVIHCFIPSVKKIVKARLISYGPEFSFVQFDYYSYKYNISSKPHSLNDFVRTDCIFLNYQDALNKSQGD
jgi:hypothetical protein